MKSKLLKKVVSLVTVSALAVALLPTSSVFADTAPVTVEKSSKWVDLDNQIAEISVKVNAKNQIVTEKTDIVFAIDASTTMMLDDMENAKAAISKFTDSISSNPNTNGKVRIGLVKYNNKAETIQSLTNNYSAIKSKLDGDLQWYKLLFNATNIQAGIKQAEDMLKGSTAENKYIIVIGDGEPTKSFRITDGTFTGTTVESTCWSYKVLEDWKLVTKWNHGIKAVNDGSFKATKCDYNDVVGNGLDYDFIFGYNVTKDYSAKCKHGDMCTCEIKHKVDDNGEATYFEANLAKNAGIKMFSIGYGVNGGDAETVLKTIANSGCYYKANKNGTEINSAVTKIQNTIVKEVSQGTNAVLTESAAIKIDGTAVNYQIVNGSVTRTQGSYTKSGNTITWNVGSLPNGSATLTYKVKITNPLPTGKKTITLGNSTLKYDNISGTTSSVTSTVAGDSLKYSKHTVKFIGYEENADRELVEKVLLQKDNFAGKTVSAPELTETAGYTFAWPNSSVTLADSDVTVKAIATKKAFNVKFFGFDGNQIGETQSIKYLESATAPADPTAVDKDFTGWGTDAWKSVTGDTDVYPEGTIKKFDVTYQVKDLETGDIITIGTINDVEYNTESSTLEAPAFALPEGYQVVEDWELPENITSDITVTKTIEKKVFNVKFNVTDSETGITTELRIIENVKYGTETSTLDIPEFTLPEGYEIASDWELPETVTSDVEVTKTIQKQTFKVIFKDFDGNTIGEEQIVKYGDSAEEPEIPVDATKTFTKWSTDEWKEVKSDLIVNAEFTAVVNLDDEDIPTTDIPDDDIPTASNPKTGVDYPLFIMMLVAFASVTTTIVLKKKSLEK